MQNSSNSSQGSYILRQMRFANTERLLEAQLNGRKYHIQDFSRFGVALVGPILEELPNGNIEDLQISCLKEIVFRGEGFIANSRNDKRSKGEFVGVSLKGEIDFEKTAVIMNIAHVQNTVYSLLHKSSHIPMEVSHKCDEFLVTVHEMRRTLDILFQRHIEPLPPRAAAYFVHELRQHNAELLHRTFAKLVTNLQPYLHTLEPENISSLFRLHHIHLSSLLEETAIYSCMRTGPLTPEFYRFFMNLGEPAYEGRTPFGQILNRFITLDTIKPGFQGRPSFLAAETVNRLQRFESQKSIKVLVVQCGDGLLVEEIIERCGNSILSRTNFEILDWSEEALLIQQQSIYRRLRKDKKHAHLHFRLADTSFSRSTPITRSVSFEMPENFEDTFDIVVVPFLFDFLEKPQRAELFARVGSIVNSEGEVLCARLRDNPLELTLAHRLFGFALERGEPSNLPVTLSAANDCFEVFSSKFYTV